jgi:NADH dehydrogenase
MIIPKSNLKRVVIIGAGFGGLELSKRLRNKGLEIVLLDKNNYHIFQPLLYQVASAGLEPDSIAHPLRKIFHDHSHFYLRMASVQLVNREAKKVITDIGEIEYDYLVIASGSSTNFYGNEKLSKLCMSMKTLPEALDIRSLLLQNFETALITNDLEKRRELMSVVIVGGGPTGVELAGALAELKRHVMPHDYPDLDVRRMEIHVVQANSVLLAGMSPKSSAAALEFLTAMGVQVWLDTKLDDYDGMQAILSNGTTLRSQNLIWAAGVKGNPIQGLPDEAMLPNGRIKVDEFNRVSQCTWVFAIGDVAEMQTTNLERGHPMLAQVAIQQGHLLADNLIKLSQDSSPIPFRYKEKGVMATIGRNKAVVDLGKRTYSGFFAWFIWMIVHVVALIGFRNKLVVVTNWTYSYLRYAKDVRLIIRPFKRQS